MSEALHAATAETPGGPAAPGAGATDGATPAFGRSLLAPFVFGLAVGYIWLLIQVVVSINLPAPAVNLSSVPPVLLLALAIGVLFVWPGAVAVVSTVGDTRFWGTGNGAQRASAAVRLALALLVALVVGYWTWISSFAAEMKGLAALQRFHILYQMVVGNTWIGVGAERALLIGLLAAFTFGRWPPGTWLAQLGRWLVVGALAVAGLLFFDTLQRWALLMTIGALAPHAGGTCGSGACPNVALTQLTQLAEELGGALVGAVLGGALRAGFAGFAGRGQPDAGADGWSGGAGMAAAVRPSRGARAWAALGLGLLCGVAWIGALFVALLTLAQSGEVAAVLLALLGALVPLGILVVGEIRRRRRAGAAQGHGAWFVLALVGVLAGLVPAYLLVRLMHLSDALLLIELLSVVTPGFSAGVALGYAFGVGVGEGEQAALADGWWRLGTRAAFWGGIGFGLSFLALLLTQFVLQTTQPVRCTGNLGGCILAGAIHIELTQQLMMASIAPVAWAVLGGVAGAALRAGVLGRARAG